MSFPSTVYINQKVKEFDNQQWISIHDVKVALKLARGEGALKGEVPPGIKNKLGIPRKPYTYANNRAVCASKTTKRTGLK